MKTKILLFFMVLSCSIIYGQRDSLYINKIQTYEPIDTAEITVGTEYEVLLKHYSIYGGSVIRRDTVDTYAAEYIRGLIVIAEKDSANLKLFLEVHHENFKNVNTEYFNIKNYLTALRNAATGRPMERQTPLEPEVEKQYICRVISGQSAPSTDSLIIGATYKITSYSSGDDFSNVGGQNYTGNVFQATGEYPGVWTNGSTLTFDHKDTTLTSGTLEIGKLYWLNDAVYGGDDFTTLYDVYANRMYQNDLISVGTMVDSWFVATNQPAIWADGTPAYDLNIYPIVLKNDLAINISIAKRQDYIYLIYSDLPIFNNINYNVEYEMWTHLLSRNKLIPISQNVAAFVDLDNNPIKELYLKITKLIP